MLARPVLERGERHALLQQAEQHSVSVAEQVGPVRVAQSIATLIETSKVLPAAEKHDVSHSGLLAHIPLSCSCLSRLASL